MHPLLTKLGEIKPPKYLGPELLIGQADGYKYVSHDMGVTWEQELKKKEVVKEKDIVPLPDEWPWKHWRHP